MQRPRSGRSLKTERKNGGIGGREGRGWLRRQECSRQREQHMQRTPEGKELIPSCTKAGIPASTSHSLVFKLGNLLSLRTRLEILAGFPAD